MKDLILMEKDSTIILHDDLEVPVIFEDVPPDNAGYVRLPMSERGFYDFINGLLGEPQTIQGYITGSYIADIKYIRDIHCMINQRIQQQNKGTLIQFLAKIFYNDGSAITITGYDEFISYREIKQNSPVQLELTWVYLIQFEDKLSPEKQTITLRFRSGEDEKFTYYSNRHRETTSPNSIEYIIKHTARTWGVDIEFLIKNSLQSFMIDKKPFRKKLSDRRTLLSVILWIISFVTCFVINNIYVNMYLSNLSTIVSKEIDNLQGIEQKFDYLSQHVSTIPLYQFTTYNNAFIIVMIVVCIILAYLFNEALESFGYMHSYIILNEDSNERRNKVEKLANSYVRKAVTMLVVNILTGIAGSFIYDFIISFLIK